MVVYNRLDVCHLGLDVLATWLDVSCPIGCNVVRKIVVFVSVIMSWPIVVIMSWPIVMCVAIEI